MKCMKRLLCSLLAIALAVSLLPASALAASGEIYTIANDYMTFTLNASTGGFGVSTVEGHPQKAFDNNIPMLYQGDGVSPSTSFVTVRIDGKDYIFGQDYNWLGINTSPMKVPVITNTGTGQLISTSWSIKGYTITMQAALAKDAGDSDLRSNVGFAFTVENKNKQAGSVGIRVLLDTALDADTDNPYLITDLNNAPVRTETEFSGAEMFSQIRGMDSLSSPRQMCYALLTGWAQDSAPDRAIVGHWANLANTRYDYTPDPNCDFTDRGNVYRTADSALAFYWSEAELAAGGTREAQFLYGVGNFSDELTDELMNLNFEVNPVEVNGNQDGYDEFEVTVTLDNTLDKSIDLSDALFYLEVEEGLRILDDKGDSRRYTVVEANDDKDKGEIVRERSKALFSLTELKKGQQSGATFYLEADPQAQITSRQIQASLTAVPASLEDISKYGQSISVSAFRYVILPSVSGLKPDVTFTGVTSDTIYFDGSKAMTVTGRLNALQALSSGVGWGLYLVQTDASGKFLSDQSDSDYWYRVPNDRVAFTGDNYSALSISLDKRMELGSYELVFCFDGTSSSELVKAFGTQLRTGLKVTVSNDPKYSTKSYGLVALVRYNQTDYAFVPFDSEAALNDFRSGESRNLAHFLAFGKDGNWLRFDQYDQTDQEILAVVRGPIMQQEDENGNIYYAADPKDGDVTINNIVAYSGSEPLIMKTEKFFLSAAGKEEHRYVITGDGKINVINSITFWKSGWKIAVQEGQLHSLNEERILGQPGSGHKTVYPVQVDFTGVGCLIQAIGSMVIDMKYGVLTEFWEAADGGNDQSTRIQTGYAISFGGKASLPLKAKQPEEPEYGPKPFSKETSLSEGGISVAIDSILYGNKSLEDKEDIGFIGIDTTAGLTLPENLLGDLIGNKNIKAIVTINTIDNIYAVDFAARLKIIECDVTLSLKQVTLKGKDTLLPDTIHFAIEEGLRVPLVPPTLFITGLGGGVENLADFCADNVLEGLPPLTVSVQARLRLIQKFIGDVNLQVSEDGMSLSGEFALEKFEKAVTIRGGAEARWASPFYLKLYGSANILDGILSGGISVIITTNSFSGYMFAAVHFPASIPLIGGKEIARVEVGVSDEFVGANVKVIGIKFGFIYYWGGDFSVGSGINLGDMKAESARARTFRAVADNSMDVLTETILSGGQEMTYYIAAGTNISPLETTPVPSRMRLMAAAEADGTVYLLDTGEQRFSPAGAEALLLEVPYSGSGVITTEDVDLLINGEPFALKAPESDEDEGGNFLVQDRGVDGRYLYISVPAEDLKQLTAARAGELTYQLRIKSSANTQGLTFSKSSTTLNAVAALPELSGAPTVSNEAGFAFDVSCPTSVSADTEVTSSALLDVYLTTDRDALDKLHGSGIAAQDVTLGDQVGHFKLETIGSTLKRKVTIPDTLPSGDYYVLTVLTLEKGGTSAQISEAPIRFQNSMLPEKVASASAYSAGDRTIAVKITEGDAQEGHPNYYTGYLVELQRKVNENTYEAVPNTLQSVRRGYEVRLGSSAALTEGETYRAVIRTVRTETEDGEEKIYQGDGVVYTGDVVLEPVKTPRLTGLDSTVPLKASPATKENDLTLTFTFDQPVSLSAYVDGVDFVTDSQKLRPADGDKWEKVYQNTWTVSAGQLDDGEHTLHFSAVNQNGDRMDAGQAGVISFLEQKELDLAFTVDTTPPVLSAGFQESKSLNQTNIPTDANDVYRSAATGGQTILAGADGSYVFCGLTEPDADLSWSLDGGKTWTTTDSLTLEHEASGEFTLKGTLTGSTGTVLVMATDKAGNTSQLSFTVLQASQFQYKSILLKVTPLGATEAKPGETDGIYPLEVGDELELKVYGVLEDHSEVELSPADVSWSILNERNLIRFTEEADSVRITARNPADKQTAIIRASFQSGSAVRDDAIIPNTLDATVEVSVQMGEFFYRVTEGGGYSKFQVLTDSGKKVDISLLLNGREQPYEMVYDQANNCYSCVVAGSYRTSDIKEIKINDTPMRLLVKGDLDGDGRTDEKDAQKAVEIFLSGGVPTDDLNDFLRGDWDGDWQVTVLDAQALLDFSRIVPAGG